MANPRDTIAFEGIGIVTATFKIDAVTIVYDSAQPGGAAATMIGKAVSLSAAGTVQLASDAEAVVGKLLLVEAGNKATVQVGGFCTLPGGASAALTLGKTIIGALGASSAKGYIREAASGAAAELVLARGRIIDAGTTTAVVVQL